MTDQQAAQRLYMMAAERGDKARRSKREGLEGCADMYAMDREAAIAGAAALRQPKLPKEWPLAWRKGKSSSGRPQWSARLPLTKKRVWVREYNDRESGWWFSGSMDTQFCTTDWSARRAAERAVSRAVKESMKG